MTLDDSLRKGYLRYKISYENGLHEIEFWKTKTDKRPHHYGLKQLREYAIKKDTFKIFHNFPYKDEVKEILQAKVIVRGRLSLYSTSDLELEWGHVGGPTGGAARQKIMTYILRDNKGYLQALDRDSLKRDLSQFISDYPELMSQLAKRSITYKNLKEITEIYNKKMK